jgi:DNA polymerase III subunit epsilon
MIKLERDLVFFDVETTGLNVVRDRILQIGLVKLHKNGQPDEEISMLINPGIPISEESMSIHGITPKDLANKPTFQQVAQKLWDFIGNADLAGYNSNRFDVPMLMEEFARVGMEFEIDKRRLIDVQRIFYKMEPRTLKAAYRLYCGKELTDAHDALADVKATLDVFKGQLQRYDGVDLYDEEGATISAPIKNDIQALHDFTNDMNFLDATQRLKVDHNGVIVFNFGKHIGQPVAEVLKKEKNYANWIMEKDFSSQVKQIIKRIVKENG